MPTAQSPGKYNQQRHQIVVEAVREGNYRATAARLSGVSAQTLINWLEAGEIASEDDLPYDDDHVQGRYRKLFEDVTEAEAQFEQEMVGKVREAAVDSPKNWTAAMTLLERTRPERFGRRDTTVIEGGDKPIKQATIHILTSPEAQDAANALLKELTVRTPTVVPAGSGEIPALPGLEEVVVDEDDITYE